MFGLTIETGQISVDFVERDVSYNTEIIYTNTYESSPLLIPIANHNGATIICTTYGLNISSGGISARTILSLGRRTINYFVIGKGKFV